MTTEKNLFSHTNGKVQFPEGSLLAAFSDFPADTLRSLLAAHNGMKKNYEAAVKEVTTKLEVLDEDFQLLYEHSPIHSIGSRIKSPESILQKVKRKGLSPDLETIREQILDIAGVRVVCNYIEDIYKIAELLKSQDDIVLIEEKDYIRKPKDNGYRSLHLVISVPVFFVEAVRLIPVEVQIRTIAMDFWASLEHQLRYKSEGHIPEFIAKELKEAADTITETDIKMENIHRFLSELDQLKL